MTERPILFSAPMVRAILEGRKTQTRRLVKPQPAYPYVHEVTRKEWNEKRQGFDIYNIGAKLPGHFWACPFGTVGDRLWVRETWLEDRLPHNQIGEGTVHYKADDRPVITDSWSKAMAWRPSIHMPRWASRITLEITEIRVQRLQGISADDCLAEGVMPASDTDAPVPMFFDLWDSIHGEGAWESNPWVWAISFNRVEVSE